MANAHDLSAVLNREREHEPALPDLMRLRLRDETCAWPLDHGRRLQTAA